MESTPPMDIPEMRDALPRVHPFEGRNEASATRKQRRKFGDAASETSGKPEGKHVTSRCCDPCPRSRFDLSQASETFCSARHAFTQQSALKIKSSCRALPVRMTGGCGTRAGARAMKRNLNAGRLVRRDKQTKGCMGTGVNGGQGRESTHQQACAICRACGGPASWAGPATRATRSRASRRCALQSCRR